jgi:dTDP-4-dehydrorhamnose 3,5-epimerase
MKRLATRLDGPVLLEPTVHGDARGFFLETFRATTLAELGLHDEWVQDNQCVRDGRRDLQVLRLL